MNKLLFVCIQVCVEFSMKTRMMIVNQLLVNQWVFYFLNSDPDKQNVLSATVNILINIRI